MNRQTGAMALPPVPKANQNKFNKLRIGDDQLYYQGLKSLLMAV
jgi:hypothetical protein